MNLSICDPFDHHLNILQIHSFHILILMNCFDLIEILTHFSMASIVVMNNLPCVALDLYYKIDVLKFLDIIYYCHHDRVNDDEMICVSVDANGNDYALKMYYQWSIDFVLVLPVTDNCCNDVHFHHVLMIDSNQLSSRDDYCCHRSNYDDVMMMV